MPRPPRWRHARDLCYAGRIATDADDLRFILPSDSDRRGRRLDELGVPQLSPGLSPAGGGALSVPGMLDVVDQDETHSRPTERRRRSLLGLLRRKR